MKNRDYEILPIKFETIMFLIFFFKNRNRPDPEDWFGVGTDRSFRSRVKKPELQSVSFIPWFFIGFGLDVEPVDRPMPV